jgi:hypothetical protein
MTTPILKFYQTTEERLDLLPVSDGQLIFVTDGRFIALDTGGSRTIFNQILYLDTESQRTILPAPLTGFYYIEETHVLWRYANYTWTAVTEKPKEEISFSDEFPDVGEEKKIYVFNGQLYQWLNNTYIPLNNSLWESF